MASKLAFSQDDTVRLAIYSMVPGLFRKAKNSMGMANIAFRRETELYPGPHARHTIRGVSDAGLLLTILFDGQSTV